MVVPDDQGCYEQLMEIRQHVLEYTQNFKRCYTSHKWGESDEIETEKLIETKRVYTELSIGKAKCSMTSLKQYLNKYGYEYTKIVTVDKPKQNYYCHSDLDELVI